MYLLIGDDSDPCIAQVSAQLRAHGQPTVVTTKPLAEEAVFSWRLSNDRSASWTRFNDDGAVLRQQDWRGVLVRSFGAPPDAAGWEMRDLAYVQTETQAALIAWLRSLPCPVINPPLAETWFRQQRVLPEQQSLFARAGLPALATIVTNDAVAARQFARRWDGAATYAPLTSVLRYPISDEAQWQELERVMAQFPICLIAPLVGHTARVSYAGGATVWNESIELDKTRRAELSEGLRRLAHLTRLELLQVELLINDGAARCINFNGYPQFAWHSAAEQEQLSRHIAALLTGEKEVRQ